MFNASKSKLIVHGDDSVCSVNFQNSAITQYQVDKHVSITTGSKSDVNPMIVQTLCHELYSLSESLNAATRKM